METLGNSSASLSLRFIRMTLEAGSKIAFDSVSLGRA